MLIVKVKPNDKHLTKALKVLKNKVRNTKQPQELRERKEFTKKSVKRRKKKMKAIYIQKKFGHLDD